MSNDPPSARFFISYTSADSEWAQWVAQTLEANGYRTELMVWDFLPGENFVVRMHEAAMAGVRVLAIVSPAYMASAFGTPEWAAAFADDPMGKKRQLVPILVETAERRGLLNQLVPIELIGKSEEGAAAELLRKLGSSERLLPETAVPFPGGDMSSEAAADQAETARNEEWVPLDEPLALLPVPASQPGSWDSSVVLEIHLTPVPPGRMQVSTMRDLPDELAATARAARFFTGSQALTAEVRDGVAVVESQVGRDVATRGLSVTRNGAICLWDGLPQDGMGAVVDVADVERRIANLIRIATQLARLDSPRVAVGGRVVTRGMYIFGDASIVGSRSSAGGLRLGDDAFEVSPDDTVSVELVRSDPEGVAREIAARLEMAWAQAKQHLL